MLVVQATKHCFSDISVCTVFLHIWLPFSLLLLSARAFDLGQEKKLYLGGFGTANLYFDGVCKSASFGEFVCFVLSK